MRALLAASLLACASCAPSLVDEPWRVEAPKVIAVVASPPEARPGETVRVRAVVASPDGPVDGAEIAWSLCTEPRPLTENGSVASKCLGPLPVVATGPAADLALPREACALFGPDTPPGEFRPRDPDATGGYFQPFRLGLGDAGAFGFERLRCNPAGVSNDVAREFVASYRPNANPVIGSLSAIADGREVAFERLPAGGGVALTLRWTPESEEPFLVVDLQALSLASARETLQVSWFVTAGRLETARTAGDEGSSSSVRWDVAAEAGRGWIWAVLRDSRGGVAVAVAAYSSSSPK